MTKVLAFVKKNAVMTIAFAAALITSFIVPVDEKYLGYFDYKTLACLFCVLAVVCALKDVNFFYILAEKVVERFKNLRLCVLALVYITFIGSMLIANDMALLTFLPLGYFVLSSTGKERYMAYVFILQNVAANLGGCLRRSATRRICISTQSLRYRISNLSGLWLRRLLPPSAL